jgi:maltoporin
MKPTQRKLVQRGALAAALLLAGSAHAFDYHGYFRAGPQKSDCYNAQGGDNTFGYGGVGRMGNECHTYGEFTLGQGGNAGAVDYQGNVQFNFFKPGSDHGNTSLPGGGVNPGILQLFLQGKGFDVAPEQTFWIGKRFGDRSYVYYDDYFTINMTGTGAGVDGIGVGSAKLDLAVYRERDDKSNTANDPLANSGTRFNADLKGIDINPGGKLRLTAVATSYAGPNGKSGLGVSLQHDQANVLGGANTIWLQYAQGTAESNMNFANDPTADSSVKRWRVVEAIQWTEGPLSGQAMLRLGQYGPSSAKVKFSSVGGHLAYAFTQNFKLRSELGVGANKPDNGARQQLTKVSIAPTLTVGPNYYDRPELRFIISRFSWNEAYRAANGLTGSGKTTAGFQAEIWF